MNYLLLSDPRLQLIRNTPKITSVDKRGWYITGADLESGVYYLQHNGTVISGVDTGFWPTEKAAYEFWEKWRIDVLLLKGAPYENKCISA